MVVSDSTPAFQLVPSAFLCHPIPDILHQSLTPIFDTAQHTDPLPPLLLLLPVVTEGKAVSRRSMVWGRRTVAHAQARTRQRSASFHSRPRTSLAGTSRERRRRKKKAPETGEQSAQTQTPPPQLCLKMLRCWSTPTTPLKLPSHWEQRRMMMMMMRMRHGRRKMRARAALL